METLTETLIPPTERERAAFDAATTGTPQDFVNTCQAAGIAPGNMLDTFDAAPWRWLFSFEPAAPVTDEVRHRTFQPPVRERLDVAREYVEASWWRRKFSSRWDPEQSLRSPYLRTRQPNR